MKQYCYGWCWGAFWTLSGGLKIWPTFQAKEFGITSRPYTFLKIGNKLLANHCFVKRTYPAICRFTPISLPGLANTHFFEIFRYPWRCWWIGHVEEVCHCRWEMWKINAGQFSDRMSSTPYTPTRNSSPYCISSSHWAVSCLYTAGLLAKMMIYSGVNCFFSESVGKCKNITFMTPCAHFILRYKFM